MAPAFDGEGAEDPDLRAFDLSPEARRLRAPAWRESLNEARQRLTPGRRVMVVLRRVYAGVVNDGTIHAGNFAYMVLIALFPFFITGAALFSLVGRADERIAAIRAILTTLPPVVAQVLQPVAEGVIAAQTGPLLWIGGIVGLWTVGSLVETVRDILRRAYGTRWTRAFWRRRLISTGLIIASVVLILVAITVQVALGTVEETLFAFAPRIDGQLDRLINELAASRFATAPFLFGALWLLFISLTPTRYRARRYPKWPGALVVTCWWQVVTFGLPKLLRHLFAYSLTYGSLAGVMITLFFFWLVGLGMVVGAELNAALAETPEERDMPGEADDREAATHAGELPGSRHEGA